MAVLKLNTELAEKAEAARQERDGESDAGTVRVKALSPVSVAGKAHDSGASFSAPMAAVRDALARGLVEKAGKS